MSMFVKNDMIVVSHKDSNDLTLIELGGENNQRTFHIYGKVVQIVEFGDPLEGKIIVVCRKKIFLLTPIDGDEPFDVSVIDTTLVKNQTCTFDGNRYVFSRFGDSNSLRKYGRNDGMVGCWAKNDNPASNEENRTITSVCRLSNKGEGFRNPMDMRRVCGNGRLPYLDHRNLGYSDSLSLSILNDPTERNKIWISIAVGGDFLVSISPLAEAFRSKTIKTRFSCVIGEYHFNIRHYSVIGSFNRRVLIQHKRKLRFRVLLYTDKTTKETEFIINEVSTTCEKSSILESCFPSQRKGHVLIATFDRKNIYFIKINFDENGVFSNYEMIKQVKKKSEHDKVYGNLGSIKTSIQKLNSRFWVRSEGIYLFFGEFSSSRPERNRELKSIKVDNAKDINSILILKSHRTRKDDNDRFNNIIEIIEKRKVSKFGISSFWPEDLSFLFHVISIRNVSETSRNIYTYSEVIKKLYIPKFFIDSCSSSVNSDETITILTKSNFDLDESEIIKFLVHGFYCGLTVNKLLHLLQFLDATNMKEHVVYLLINFHQFLSTKDVLHLFKLCLEVFETKNERTNEEKTEKEEEEEEEDLISLLMEDEDEENSTSRKFMKTNFRSGIVLGLFTEILRRRSEVTLHERYRLFLHRIGYSFEFEHCKYENMARLEDHTDFHPLFNDQKFPLECKEQLKDFSDLQTYWMNKCVIKCSENVSSSSSNVILSSSSSNFENGVRFPKLFLILFSNFFSKMFRYEMAMRENSEQNVHIEGIESNQSISLLIDYFINRFSSTENHSNSSLVGLLDVFTNVCMFSENTLSVEVEMDIVSLLNELSKNEEIVLKLLEVGYKLLDLPVSIQRRILGNVSTKDVSEKSMSQMLKYSKQVKENTEGLELENEELKKKLQKRKLDESKDDDDQPKKKKRKRE